MEKLSKEQEIIKQIFKNPLEHYNSRSLSKEIGISHVGAFKILRRLEKRRIVKSERIGRAVIYSINNENPVAWKEIELTLAIEASNSLRWVEEFRSIQKIASFAVLFGSILKDEKNARDIDLLVVADKERFKDIKKEIEERNKILSKKVHLILQTPEEFDKDIKSRNNVIMEIIKKGIVLFGQEEITKPFR